MGVNIGTKTAQKMFVGENPVKAIYKGSELVWGNDFNIDRFHELCPAATATAVTFDYKAAIDVSDCTMLGYIDTAETIEVWNKDTDYFVLSDYEIRPRSCAKLFQVYKFLTTIVFNNFDTSAVTDMSYCFAACSVLTALDLSGLDTHAVTNMSSLFGSCSKLTDLNLSGFDTHAVTNMTTMFNNCRSLRALDLSGFDTHAVQTMQGTFQNCSELTVLDLSGWNTQNVENLRSMFYNCPNLQKIYTSKNFDFDQPYISSYLMFLDCKSLIGGNGTIYDPKKIDKTYFRIDTPETPGYLTLKQ